MNVPRSNKSPARSIKRRKIPIATSSVAVIPVPPIRSWRSERVARWFGLPIAPTDDTQNVTPGEPPLQSLPLPETGQIVLLSGASGSGKSTLLRQVIAELERTGRRVIDLARLPLPDVPVVDCLPDLPLESMLMLLGRMGLGEAWTYLRTPTELSDGQRWRLRLAMAVHEADRWLSREGASEPAACVDDDDAGGGGDLRARRDSRHRIARRSTNERSISPHQAIETHQARSPVIVCDEFAALLDRVTAAIVSRSIRKLIDASLRLSAVVATSHDDVIRPLLPDRHVRCDFGEFKQT